MAELMLGQPLFPGESGIDQLVEIIKVLGTPTREQIKTMNPNVRATPAHDKIAADHWHGHTVHGAQVPADQAPSLHQGLPATHPRRCHLPHLDSIGVHPDGSLDVRVCVYIANEHALMHKTPQRRRGSMPRVLQRAARRGRASAKRQTDARALQLDARG